MFLRHLHREVAADARLFHTFFNQDAGNFVLIASQVDLLICRRGELPTPPEAARCD